MEAENTDNKPKRPVYKSQDGFTEVELLRGFDEIRKLYNVLVTNTMGSFICGGYARWCASPKPDNKAMPGDVDIYSDDEGDFKRLTEVFSKEGLNIRHENEIALTYVKPQSGMLKYTPTNQLIKPNKEGRVVALGTREDILSNFDFTVVRAAILDSTKVLVDADFIHDETEKILRLKNIHCPISLTLRCMKYATKGYWLPVPQAMKLFLDWDSRDD
jgi:hypothetical protein